jgi:hypothetical protein
MTPVEAGALGAHLQAAGAGHVIVDRFLGDTAVASVFLGHDVGDGRAVMIKVVDSDLAYDVGGAEFVRGIGSASELADPHILPPGAGVPRAVCYVGAYAPAEPLREHLSRAQPVGFADAIRIATDIARVLGRWHALGLAHGSVHWETLLIQSGHVLLSPPDHVTSGWDAQHRDVRALARLCLHLLEPSVQPPERDRRWQRLRATLLRAAQGSGPPSLSAQRLADRLTEVEYQVTRPEAGRSTRFRRLLAAVWGRLSVIPGAVS